MSTGPSVVSSTRALSATACERTESHATPHPVTRTAATSAGTSAASAAGSEGDDTEHGEQHPAAQDVPAAPLRVRAAAVLVEPHERKRPDRDRADDASRPRRPSAVQPRDDTGDRQRRCNQHPGYEAEPTLEAQGEEQRRTAERDPCRGPGASCAQQHVRAVRDEGDDQRAEQPVDRGRAEVVQADRRTQRVTRSVARRCRPRPRRLPMRATRAAPARARPARADGSDRSGP